MKTHPLNSRDTGVVLRNLAEFKHEYLLSTM
jgi:hypothetical protein